MNVVGSRNLNQKYYYLPLMACLGFIVQLASCVEPPGGTVEELVKVDAPTFSGSSSQIFTTPTPLYVLRGDCDPRSLGIEYSFDEATWIEITEGCPSGQFSISLTITSFKKVFARAKTKLGVTSTATAIVRFAVAPTTGTSQFVVAGSSVNELQPGIPFTMGHAFTGERASSASFHLNSSLTGVVYGEP